MVAATPFARESGERQLLGINLYPGGHTPLFMGHHGQMHPQRPGGSTVPDIPAHAHRRVSSFRSRRAALTEAQQDVWDRLWPRLGMLARPTDSGDKEHDEPLDTECWFGRTAPLVIEIGCGTGTSTLAMAADEPDIDVIAVEVYRRGLAQLLSAIDREAVSNIRLIRGDGIDVLEHLVRPGSLTGVRMFFPDPWPKSRHHKRRLFQPQTVTLITERLRPGGVLHVATDHRGYAEQIAVVGNAEPGLRPARPGEQLAISKERPATKYESKARHAGDAVTEFLWVKQL
jgi:tRNA (guanine-N7-)-methyltransferase